MDKTENTRSQRLSSPNKYYKDPTADEAMRNIHAASIDFEKFATLDELVEFVRITYDAATKAKALDVIKRKMPRESSYQKKILKMIRSDYPEAFAWKEAAGPYSRAGIPDISCIYLGYYIGFEVKRPFIGRLGPMQEKVIRQIKAAGGEAYVVSFASEVKEKLEAIRRRMDARQLI